jgi:hypothetical protein
MSECEEVFMFIYKVQLVAYVLFRTGYFRNKSQDVCPLESVLSTPTELFSPEKEVDQCLNCLMYDRAYTVHVNTLYVHSLYSLPFFVLTCCVLFRLTYCRARCLASRCGQRAHVAFPLHHTP